MSMFLFGASTALTIKALLFIWRDMREDDRQRVERNQMIDQALADITIARQRFAEVSLPDETEQLRDIYRSSLPGKRQRPEIRRVK